MKLPMIRAILKKPFPVSENPYSQFKALIWIGLFVFLFLYFIKPFGIANLKNEDLKISFVFGCITFISGSSYGLFSRFVLGIKDNNNTLTLGKWILDVIGLILVISFSNFIYAHIKFDLPYSQLGYMIQSTFIVGVFPTVFIGTISMLISERKNFQIASQLNDRDLVITNPKQHTEYIFAIPTIDILYIESLQNYINIHYYENEEIKKKTERATLKSVELMIKDKSIVKCHRSYIVNNSKIESVSGNAQGLKLKLSNIDFLVPVSRSYIPGFRA